MCLTKGLGQVFNIFVCKPAFRVRVSEEYMPYAVVSNYVEAGSVMCQT